MTTANAPTAVTVDLRWRDNGYQHHTRAYQQNEQKTSLVVRRGAPFNIYLRFNANVTQFSVIALNISTDSFGQDSLERSWVLKEITGRLVDDTINKCPLQMNVIKSKSDSANICLQLTSKQNAVVSKFNITKVTLFQAPNNTVSLDTKASVILIFNPFNIDDQVFMGAEKERQEYVMEDSGMLYLRNPKTWRGPGKPWFFGQFDSPVLECALLLLSKTQLPWEDWCDPVKVSRALSAVVNCNDEGGLLYGRWDGDYSDGHNPSDWTGSLKIFQEYRDNNGTPVMYGQCWVFSGCLTSAGRTLGIPTRSVTNFSSAHDTNANLLIDSYYNATGQPFPEKNADSVWNFHVWNEMWMTRPDLGEQYRGWQAVDSTPQELSGGIYQTGPCPVVAIKRGEINVPHDGNFIYSEVNACVKVWVTRDDGKSWIEASSDSRQVGKYISTKAVGSNTRQDVTDQYKYPEGSLQEQAAFDKARKLAIEAGARRVPEQPPPAAPTDLPVWDLRVTAASDAVHFGADAVAEVSVKNVSSQERTGSCHCVAVVKNSVGKKLKELDAKQMKLDLPGGGECKVQLEIKADQYMEFGHEEIDIVVVAALTDSENRVQTMDRVIGIIYPKLIVQMPAKLVKETAVEIVLQVNNDLTIALTDAKFSIEGPGLRSDNLEQKVNDVQPGNLATATFPVTFYRAGPTQLSASFSSKEMTGVFKQVSFNVDYN